MVHEQLETGPNAGDVYTGEFQDGKRNGRGTYKFVNGNQYQGEWKNHIPNGRGTYTFANGNMYIGEYKDGKRNGAGLYKFSDGGMYVGQFKEEKREGEGTYTYPNSRKYVGQWESDKMNGAGTLYAADGKILNQGIWKDNNFIQAQGTTSAEISMIETTITSKPVAQENAVSKSEDGFQAYLNKNPMGSPQGSKPTNFQFVVTPNDSQQLTALNIKPPSNTPHANPNVFVHCGNEEYGNSPSEKSKLSGISIEDGKFFIVTAQSTYIVLDDTVAGESKQEARYIVNFDTCKMESFTPTTADIGRLRISALKNQNTMMYLGPTFKCPDFKCGTLGSLIADQSYINERLGRTDIELYQPVQALRHAYPEQRNALRDRLSKELKSIEQSCRLPARFAKDPLGNLSGTEKFAPCVKNAYSKLRAAFVAQAASYGSSDMREEIARNASDHVFAQLLLKQLGFLPAAAEIDGSYGQGTRTAIMAAQAEAKQDQSGFMSNATFDFLIKKT